MLRLSKFLVSFIVLNASLLACQAEPLQGPKAVQENSQAAPLEPSSSLVLELERAILVLKRGLKASWKTRNRYLIEFENTPTTNSAGQFVIDAKKYVECAIGINLRTHQIWDEGPPLGVEVERLIIQLTRLRNETKQARKTNDGYSNPDGESAKFRLPPCVLSPPKIVAVSAGVAAAMLKTKIDPVYPADADVSGTVVLHAMISSVGRVVEVHVISGPAMLQQAAIDAVRQWTYRPYRLNNKAVQVETTINVVFLPRR